MTNNNDRIKTAIENVVSDLKREKDILNLVGFLQAVNDGTYSQWRLYKQELSRLAEIDFKGRPVPLRYKVPGAPKEMEKVNLQKGYVSIGKTHNLDRFRTPVEKVKYLLSLNLPDDVLMDYLSFIKASLTQKDREGVLLALAVQKQSSPSASGTGAHNAVGSGQKAGGNSVSPSGD